MDYEQICDELKSLGFVVRGSEVRLNDQKEGCLFFRHGGQNLIEKVSAKSGSRFERIVSAWNIKRWPWNTPAADWYFENSFPLSEDDL